MKTLADAYGAALAAQAYAVPSTADGGSPGGMVIGTKNADGTVTYAPAQSVMAAAALLDMAALRRECGVDAGPAVQAWTSTAQQVLSYVLARGHGPDDGPLLPVARRRAPIPEHDTPGPGTPTSDSMLTETQAWVVLGLARAQDLLDPLQQAGIGDAGASDGGPRAPGGLLTAAVGDPRGLDDRREPLRRQPDPAGAAAPPGAFLEGLVLSGQQLLTDKTTIGNSVMLGGFERVYRRRGARPSPTRLGEVRRPALVQLTPAHSSLLTIVTDSNDDGRAAVVPAGRLAAVRLRPRLPGRRRAAEEQGATNYRSDAVHAMVEGVSQLWHGAADDARCAP